jgi:hypothetical protein
MVQQGLGCGPKLSSVDAGIRRLRQRLTSGVRFSFGFHGATVGIPAPVDNSPTAFPWDARTGMVVHRVKGAGKVTLQIPATTPSLPLTVTATGSDGERVATVSVTMKN